MPSPPKGERRVSSCLYLARAASFSVTSTTFWLLMMVTACTSPVASMLSKRCWLILAGELRLFTHITPNRNTSRPASTHSCKPGRGLGAGVRGFFFLLEFRLLSDMKIAT